MKQISFFGWRFIIPIIIIFIAVSGMGMARGAALSVGGGPLGVAAHPDGSYVFVANSGDNSVTEIQVSDRTVTRTFQVSGFPADLVVSPDGNLIYVTTNESDGVSIIQRSDGTTTDVAAGSGPWGVVLDSSGANLYVTNRDENTVSVFDTLTNTITETIAVGAEPIGLAISSDDSTLFVSNMGDNTVSVIQLSAGEVTGTVNVGAEPLGVRLNGQGDSLYVANFGDDTVSVIRVEDLSVRRSISVNDGPSETAISPDGRYVYVTCSNDNSVAVIDTSDDSVLTRPVENVPAGIDVLPDGSFYYVANFGSDSVSVLYRLLVEIISVSRPAVQSTGTVEIQWRAGDAGSYRVESGGNDDPGTGNLLNEGTVAAEETITTIISGDSLGAEEGSYRVFIYVSDGSGETGSNYTTIRLDNTPPSAPTGFAGTVGDERIFLDWNAGGESDLAGYRIFFGTASGRYDAQGSPVSITDSAATSFTLENLENNVDYFLVLTAVDQAGNESQLSEEIVVTPEEVLGITGLSGESENGCFVAAVFSGSDNHKIVRALRRMRDEFLAKDVLGRGIIRLYYSLGPGAARFIAHKPALKYAVRGALRPLAYMGPLLPGKAGPMTLLAIGAAAGLLIIQAIRFIGAWPSRKKNYSRITGCF
ncbi:MAG: beta-propeller fold lactonase family protein [Deltaproteobacteria bacterium]|nr:beta-propeller fold lactonase family protein [Deltaproteobacteria bacterium]